MGRYNFYYDESEHSRKINHKTITADNYYDSFVTAIVGWCEDDESEIAERYSLFEKKYENRKSKGELKSTTIGQPQFVKGFASLNKANVSLLDDFLSLFDEKTLVYFSVASKMEYVIGQVFEDYENSPFADMGLMKYSITKVILLYQPKEILEGLYKDTGELVALLKNFFLAQIEKDKENESLKQREIGALTQILILLDSVTTIKTIDWNYDIPFVGFKSLLAEIGVEDYSLVIDKEGEGNTAKAAERVGLHSVTQANSLSFFGIRMADMLVGVITKLLKALHDALKYASPEEQFTKKVLDKRWFEVNDRQLTLYKKLHTVAIELNNAWYKVFAGRYSDDLVILIAFLRFMNRFESVDEIRDDIDMQAEYFNTYTCGSLEEHYRQISNKLPIDIENDTSRGYTLNRRGAKVYFDKDKQPLLNITNGQITCDVLSVGFSKEMIPLVTISEGSEAKCYRLPIELAEWATSLVGFANMGGNLFPAKVMFSEMKGRYYADII